MAIKAVEWARGQLGRAWRETDPASGAEIERRLGPRAVLVLVEIADCINRRHEFAFPGQERLMRAAGVQERQVRRLVRELEAAGCIKALPGKGRGHGRGREPDRYYLACDPETGKGKLLPALPAARMRLTGGHAWPAVDAPTAGQPGHLQPVKSDTASLYEEKPESEPARAREGVEAHAPAPCPFVGSSAWRAQMGFDEAMEQRRAMSVEERLAVNRAALAGEAGGAP